MRYDAIVIGAGPAGATTALMLARAGWSVAIVEKAAFPRRKVCGEFMSATNAPLFAELGLSYAIGRAAGPEVRRVGLFARDAEITAPMPSTIADGSGWGRAIGREVLDTLLLERAVAAGAECWQPWSVVRHSVRDGLGVCTIARKGEEHELVAPVVVAAHGSWERGALPTQIVREHQPSDLLGFKAHFRHGGLAQDLMPLLAFPGGYGGMVNSDDGRLSLTLCIRRDTLEGARRRHGIGAAADAVLAHVTSSCTGVARALDGAVIDGAWLAAGPINPGIRARYRDGIFRVGNVAAEAHPVVAEGISMAMQSGWLLARHLIEHGGDPNNERCRREVGRAYSAAWLRRFAPRIYAASLFAHAAMRPGSVTMLLPIFKQLPALLTLGASVSGKTSLPLSWLSHSSSNTSG